MTNSDLSGILALVALDEDCFVGVTPETRRQRVFGGQVAGQSLVAAGATVVPDRRPHSLHATFLRPGNTQQDIRYAVARLRDGRTFSTRRVSAWQGRRLLFECVASFHVNDRGPEHQAPPPEVPGPSGLRPLSAVLAKTPAASRVWHELPGVDVRSAFPATDGLPGPDPTDSMAGAVWLRAQDSIAGGLLQRLAALTFLSDLTLLGSALHPHGLRLDSEDLQTASLDHAIWFHGDYHPDRWHLYAQRSPFAGRGRGLAIGHIYASDGRLVATVAQEGLLRQVD